MGRHSAPDDPDDVPSTALALRERDSADSAGDSAEDRGRHSRSGGDAEHEALGTTVPASAAINGTAPPRPLPPPRPSDTVAADPVPAAARPAPVTAAVPAGDAPSHTVLRGVAHNSAADLHLVRSHRGVLAMCAVAVVVPFVVEVVVLLVLGTLTGHRVLVWLWAPLVVAGVLLGVALDIAHRRHTADQGAAPPSTAPLSTTPSSTTVISEL